MIGIFDSGIGGLTVVKAVMAHLPGYDTIYYGDTARTPYGSKSRRTVIGYSIENTEFLITHGAKIIVIACNTASSVATDALKKTFNVPIFEVITPAVEMAVDSSPNGMIGVIGTRATINSNIYEKKVLSLSPTAKVYSKPCPLLVPLVEEGWLNKPETRMIVKKYIHPLKARQIDTLILGCTHYPLISDIIKNKVGKQVNIIDSSTGVARKIESYLDSNRDIKNELGKNGVSRIFVSDITEQFEKTARRTLKKNLVLESHLPG